MSKLKLIISDLHLANGRAGLDGFGASAPFEDLYKHFGITPEAIAAAVKRRLVG